MVRPIEHFRFLGEINSPNRGICGMICTKVYAIALVGLSGRDLIRIAFTGSGKTLTFGLPRTFGNNSTGASVGLARFP